MTTPGVKPRLLDLFCGAGGAAMGYHQAGFDVIGVDIARQPRYPFEFVQADALMYPLDGFDAIHASPPCQLYSVANNIHGNTEHPDLLPPTRDRLMASGLPWVLENVPGAPMANYEVLCGLAFGLGVKRHRWFETSWRLTWAPPMCPKGHRGDWVSVFGHTVLERGHVIGKAKGGGNRIKRRHLGVQRGRDAMGIDWMNRDELSEAIPPTYTRFIGEQLLDHLASTDGEQILADAERARGTRAQPVCGVCGLTESYTVHSTPTDKGFHPFSPPVGVLDPQQQDEQRDQPQPQQLCPHGQLAPHSMDTGVELGAWPTIDCPGPGDR